MMATSKAAQLPLWALAGLQLVLGAAQAQAPTPTTAPASSTSAPARPEPADPKAPVPAAKYVSPLRAYQGLSEAEIAPWRDTNERVRQRRPHAHEHQEPDAPTPASPGASQTTPAAKPAAGAHAGQDMQRRP